MKISNKVLRDIAASRSRYPRPAPSRAGLARELLQCDAEVRRLKRGINDVLKCRICNNKKLETTDAIMAHLNYILKKAVKPQRKRGAK